MQPIATDVTSSVICLRWARVSDTKTMGWTTPKNAPSPWGF